VTYIFGEDEAKNEQEALTIWQSNKRKEKESITNNDKKETFNLKLFYAVFGIMAIGFFRSRKK